MAMREEPSDLFEEISFEQKAADNIPDECPAKKSMTDEEYYSDEFMEALEAYYQALLQEKRRQRNNPYYDYDEEDDWEYYRSIQEKYRPNYTKRSFTDYFEGGKYRKDLKQSLKKEAKKVSYVPFHAKNTFRQISKEPRLYETMDRKQQRWYFFWRRQLLDGNPVKTDMGYMLVLFYEAMADGMKNTPEAYARLEQLSALAYDWYHDMDFYTYLQQCMVVFQNTFHYHKPLPDYGFIQSQNLLWSYYELRLPYADDETLGFWSRQSMHPLKLANSQTFALLGRSFKSHFLGTDLESEYLQAVSLAIGAADIWYIKTKEKGLLSLADDTKKVAVNLDERLRTPYNPEYGKEYAVQTRNYLHSQALKDMVFRIAKCTENTLRQIHNVKRKVRYEALDPSLQSYIEELLHMKFDPKQQQAKSKKLDLDFDKIARLRKDSNEVRNALEVQDAPESGLDAASPSNAPAKTQKTVCTASQISDLYKQLTKQEVSMLKTMAKQDFAVNLTERRQGLAESINEKARLILGKDLLFIQNKKLLAVPEFKSALMEQISPAESTGMQEAEKPETNTLSGPVTEPESRIPEKPEDASKLPAADMNLTSASEKMMEFLHTLSPLQLQTLDIVISQKDVMNRLDALAQENFSMPEMLVDEVNSLFTDIYDDILIDTMDEPFTILEEYQDLISISIKEAE